MYVNMIYSVTVDVNGRPAMSMRDVSFSSSMMQSTQLSGIPYCDDKGSFVPPVILTIRDFFSDVLYV